MSKQERVKINRPGVKGVLAFFLLPQFWRSFGHFSHIKPTFIRTLALMLEQSGLLPINHSATRYSGLKEQDNITIRGIMGEAWFHLRTRKDVGLYQWSMFGSIVMMFALFVGAIAMTFVYFASGTIAQAQIFNHLGGATDLSVVPVYGGTGGFDTSDPAASPSGDLAIGILDKVLRQGAQGTGGALQDAIAPMFGTYSAAVLIIASIIVFWSIVSIVVDSARTGQFGGGRHNMVWTPIRFVFALGILVPIGGGFNSGQMIVMKMAEWGSNLGTNMWSAYVAPTATPDLLVNGLTAVDPGQSLIYPYLKNLICMKENNMAAEVAHGASVPAFAPNGYPVPTAFPPPPVASYAGAMPHPEWIREVPDTAAWAAGNDTYAVNIGNEAQHNLCGRVYIPNPGSLAITGGLPGSPPPDAIAIFKVAVRIAQNTALNSVKADMELYACAYASKNQAAPVAMYPNTCPVTGAPATPDGITITHPCNGGAASGFGGSYPAKACRDLIIANYLASFDTAVYGVGGFVDTILMPYITTTLVPETQAYGWAGMGAWYYKIANINRAAASAQETETKASSSMTTSSAAAAAPPACPMFIPASFCATMHSIGKFADDAISFMDSGVNSSFAMAKDIIDQGFVQTALHEMKQGDGTMLVNIGQWGQNTHPISQLTATGSSIIDKSLSMYNWIMMLNLAAAIPFFGGIVEALMAGPIGGLLGMFASFGMLPGVMLLYYVPLIPWIRVVFAVMAWIVSVVEAVVTIPVIALAHLRTDGEGLMGPMTQGSYIAWLNLLLRPGLTVIGFVMAGLIFETMVLYTNDTFNNAISSMGSGGFGVLDQVVNTYLYVMIVYALLNASFKLVDIIPNSTMAWLGGPQGHDFSGEAGIIERGVHEIGSDFAHGVGGVMGKQQPGMGAIRGSIGGTVGGIVSKMKK